MSEVQMVPWRCEGRLGWGGPCGKLLAMVSPMPAEGDIVAVDVPIALACPRCGHLNGLTVPARISPSSGMLERARV